MTTNHVITKSSNASLRALVAIICALTILLATGCGVAYTIWGAKATSSISVSISNPASANAVFSGKSVLLVDSSISIAEKVKTASYSGFYDEVRYFSDSLDEKSGRNSCIAEALTNALSIGGYSKIGILTDMEEYNMALNDVESWENLVGTYSDTEVIINLVDGYKESNLKKGVTSLRDVLDSSCSLRVFAPDGNELTEYGFSAENAGTTSSDAIVKVEIPNNMISDKILCWIIVAGIDVISLIVLICCLFAGNDYIIIENNCSCHCPCTVPSQPTPAPAPTGIDAALEVDAILLDGSGSVKRLYKKFLDYCRNTSTKKLFRFAAKVQECTCDEARAMSPEGGTSGFTAMKAAYDVGCKTISIVSDFDFTDDKSDAMGVRFQKIICVVAKGDSQAIASTTALEAFADVVEIVEI